MHSNNMVWGMGITRDIGVIARDVSVDFGRFWRSLKETEDILKNEMFWKAMLLIQSKKVLIILQHFELSYFRSDERYLHIPLMLSERCWAYAMQLRQESNTEQRKKFHLVQKLRKACIYALQLDELCKVNVFLLNVIMVAYIV